MPATSIENKEDQQIGVAPEIVIHANGLQQPRDELLEESGDTGIRKRSKCYVANVLIGGILTTALIDTEPEVTCISGKFVNKNKERLQECPTLVVPKLSRPSIIGINLLDGFRSNID